MFSPYFFKYSIIGVRILKQASLAVHSNQNNFCGMQDYRLQCFDTVGWAAGRASGL